MSARGKAVKGSSEADSKPGWHVARASGADRRAGDGKGSSAMSRREVDQALRAFKEAGNTGGVYECAEGPGGPRHRRGCSPTYHCDIGVVETRRLARGTLREMERKGIVANTITYSALISACEKGGKWERAELAREMERKGIVGNTITYSALTSACEKGGQWSGRWSWRGRWSARTP